MSDMFEPRKVEIADIRIWWRESLDLIRRRWWFYLITTVIYYGLIYQIGTLSWLSLLLGLLLCQVFILFLIIGSQATDESRHLKVSDYIGNLKNLVVYLLVLSLIYILVFILFLIIGLFLGAGDIGVDYSQNDLYLFLRWLEPGTIRFEIVYMCITVSSLWFLNPLLMLNSLKLKDCVLLANKARRKNETVVFLVSYGPFFLFYILLLTTEFNLGFAFFAFPVFCVIQYVSYRHVFLGKRENQKLQVKQPIKVRGKALAK